MAQLLHFAMFPAAMRPFQPVLATALTMLNTDL
jgi:hypothetical protein